MTENMVETQETVTDAVSQEENTNQEKVFTQEQVNEIVAKRISQVNKRFADIDVDEYRELKTLRQQQEEEQMINRQEFEKLLKQTKAKADEEVTTLRSELEKIKVDGALINAASKAGSVNPEHIAQLLKKHIRLDSNGSVSVVDSEGNVRYNDSADPMSVDDLTEEFLNANTYYRVAGPSGSGSQSNTEPSRAEAMDLNSLDLTRADHREIYKKWKAEGKV